MADTRITVLAPDVANKIAAGEVVERPVSVVKELVENALDAGASRVAVNVDGGGRTLIRVSDDGTGMSRADAELAVQRHATSKIKNVRDIDAINTLGFRGEALPSIASVSHFELLTCDRESGKAARIRIDGGIGPDCVDASRAPGTTVSVSNLFYCVPARAKFLKTTATELSHIGRFMHSVVLAWPRTGFTYTVDGASHFDVPPQPVETPFLEAVHTRLEQLRGTDFVHECIPVAYTGENTAVEGYVTSWSRSVLTRREMYLYVNQRSVKCPWLPALLKRAYGSLLSADRYPYAFLFLHVDPRVVDVNIHPGKREVRFSNEFKIQSVVSRGVTNALNEKSAAPAVTLEPAVTDIPAGILPRADADTKVLLPRKHRDPWSARLTVEEWKRLYGKEQQNREQEPVQAVHVPGSTEAGEVKPSEPGTVPPHGEYIKAVGQAGEMYIVAEMSGVRNGLVLVDQHAAHERVNYDKVLKAMDSRRAPGQPLLMPLTIHLSAAQAAVIKGQLGDLQAAGFGIEEFGSDTFKIDAVPGYMDIADLDNLLVDIADDFLELGSSSRIEELRRRLALVLVCRGSVKFNQILSQQEMQALLEQLMETDTPWTCPHGRPTMIVLPYDELEKRFGRRG
jgi:DNA mismatch repair protein MutL